MASLDTALIQAAADAAMITYDEVKKNAGDSRSAENRRRERGQKFQVDYLLTSGVS